MAVNVRYLLGRALSPGASLVFDAQSTRIMNADVIIALGWMGSRETQQQQNADKTLASILMRVKYGLEWECLPVLYRLVHARARVIFVDKGWMSDKKPVAVKVFDGFVAELVAEWFDGVCRGCKGHGVENIYQYGSPKCGICKGKGSEHKASNRKRAESLGIAESTFRSQDWEPRFAECRAVLDGIEDRARSRMNYHLMG